MATKEPIGDGQVVVDKRVEKTSGTVAEGLQLLSVELRSGVIVVRGPESFGWGRLASVKASVESSGKKATTSELRRPGMAILVL